MSKIFCKQIIIFCFFSLSIAAAQNLEEVNLQKKSQKIQSIDEITADLKAKKEAAEPFKEKDIRIDVESLGLDVVDEKKPDGESLAKQNQPMIAQPSLPKPPKTQSKTPLPVALPNPSGPQQISQEKKLQPIQSVHSAAPNSSDVSQDLQPNQSVFGKIQNFIKTKNLEKQKVSSKATPDFEKSIDKSLQKIKNEKLQARVAREKQKSAAKKNHEERELKMIRLDKLREEYLIKNYEDDEFKSKNPNEIIKPKQKSLRWSDRFISYENPPPPILDRYRGNDNKHIPLISTFTERVDEMFDIIRNSDDNEYFNAAYKYILDPNIMNRDGETILTYATLFQRYGVITSAIAKGADPDLPNNLGHTPLDIAIEISDLKAAQILLAMNANPNYVDGFGRTYLMHAARVGFLPMVDLLISQNINLDVIDDDGFTALAIAYKHKKEVIVKLLLKSGASTFVAKPYGAEKHHLIKDLEHRFDKKSTESKI